MVRLIKKVGDKDVATRYKAARALQFFTPASRAAVPALTKALKDSNADVRRRAAQELERSDDPAGKQERAHHGRQRRGGRHGEDLHVVVHVEHDPAGRQDGAEGQHDREQGESHQLEPHRRQEPQPEGRHEPDCERGRGQDERDVDHGMKR